MRVLTMNFSGTAQRAWVADRACLLNGAQNTAGNVLISKDPSKTAAAFATDANNANTWDYYLWLSSGSATASAIARFPLQIPVAEGDAIYVATAQACYVFLYLEDVLS
jgi:hypothetical protein